ncbi:PREDICTED: uncharacterized protein LOC101310855 isoform X1 [Fragaria vesca subsp. vesca]|uniref:uncharacterized protein LOC101310855 isoform X1 n=1 Tax=Fragaria vesca subsp. vesca TaxID=101020 RepID=UPI0002C3740B|nr:PREDICTED: uncharacterized protein LOC101310855 isoform X1 [Fragaria vesca subsp. vesca]
MAENYEADVQELVKEDFLPYDGNRSALVERFRLAIMANDLGAVKECVAIAERFSPEYGKKVLLNATDREGWTPLFTALQHDAKECFHYLFENGSGTIRASEPRGDMHALTYALDVESGKVNWGPKVQSLPNLILQLGEKRYGGSPIMRLFQQNRYLSTWCAKVLIRGEEGRCSQDVIGFGIVLRLNEETEANYKLDLGEIHETVCQQFTNAAPQAIDLTDPSTEPTKMPEPTKMLICQALLIQGGEVKTKQKNNTGGEAAAGSEKLKLEMMQSDLVEKHCCFGCREIQKSKSFLWENKPCSHVLWCADCKECLMKITEGPGHPCVLCGATVISILPVLM